MAGEVAAAFRPDGTLVLEERVPQPDRGADRVPDRGPNR
jgi:hypothetical protein